MINKTLSRFATHDNSAYPQLWRGCVGAWCPSLGPSGSRLHNYSRKTNWGTLTNMDPATDWVVSSGAYALDFDGVDDAVIIDTASLLYPRLFNLAASSICAWVYARSNTGEPFVYAENRTDNNVIYLLRSSNGKWQFGHYAQGPPGAWSFSTDSANLVMSRWVHLCGTFTSSAGTKLYVDGVQVASATIGNWTTDTINDVRIGERLSADRWNGQIDDVRGYDRALSGAEVWLLSRRRGIAFTPRTRRLAVPEQVDAGVAKPVLFHSYYMSQGMRP